MHTTRLAPPAILTGPIPVYRGSRDDATWRHREALFAAGWNPGQGVRYFWPTATVVWDGIAKRIWIVAEDDVTPADWRGVLEVLRMTGWLAGREGYTDIGEPGFDLVSRVWLWDLTCP
jgi:hypothetical protein